MVKSSSSSKSGFRYRRKRLSQVPSACLPTEISKEVRGLDVEHGVTQTAGLMSHGLKQVGLAYSHWSYEEHPLFSIYEIAVGQVTDLPGRQLGVEGEVEALQPHGCAMWK